LPFNYFIGRPEARTWLPVPEAARAALPRVETIVALGGVARRRAEPDTP
jgi:hypothetical protein